MVLATAAIGAGTLDCGSDRLDCLPDRGGQLAAIFPDRVGHTAGQL